MKFNIKPRSIIKLTFIKNHIFLGVKNKTTSNGIKLKKYLWQLSTTIRDNITNRLDIKYVIIIFNIKIIFLLFKAIFNCRPKLIKK